MRRIHKSNMKTFKDIYKFPLHLAKYGSWVWDDNDQFVFQFEFEDKEKRKLLLDVINREKTLTNKELSFSHEKGYILDNNSIEVLLIRGWGNLTGQGAHNLEAEEAANIQDTFADYIVKRLNKR